MELGEGQLTGGTARGSAGGGRKTRQQPQGGKNVGEGTASRIGCGDDPVGAQEGSAATLKWANDGDVSSMEPYFINETFLLGFLGNVYEPLVGRGKELELVPKLAVSWEQTEPTVWRFHLRPNVKFADGTPFSADDVVFSYDRVTGPESDMRAKLGSVKEVKKVDDLTVDFVTKTPNPLLPGDLSTWLILSKVWCEKNGAIKATRASSKEENYANRHTNGTGPFMVTEREPDVRTVAVSNPHWWGKREGNVSEIDFRVIKSDATRVAALLSGEVNMVYTVPIQDVERINSTPHRKVLQGPEMRTIFLGLQQALPELKDSDVQGQEPSPGRARAQGLLPGDRRGRDRQQGDARGGDGLWAHGGPLGQRLGQGAQRALPLRSRRGEEALGRGGLCQRLQRRHELPE